jgi:hypothetical protein
MGRPLLRQKRVGTNLDQRPDADRRAQYRGVDELPGLHAAADDLSGSGAFPADDDFIACYEVALGDANADGNGLTGLNMHVLHE